ncbi:MAG: hypothetical protein JWN70_2550 [Planctomycetaceae bacterium]|nr:hypothetical protein [Planctomycetaceae bacterium]
MFQGQQTGAREIVHIDVAVIALFPDLETFFAEATWATQRTGKSAPNSQPETHFRQPHHCRSLFYESECDVFRETTLLDSIGVVQISPD